MHTGLRSSAFEIFLNLTNEFYFILNFIMHIPFVTILFTKLA